MHHGILLIDKPRHWTSFDVVNYVRRHVAAAEGKKPKNVKVGHTGTLDPLATGLLVLLIGKDYTRRAAAMSKHDKTYQVTMHLGANSSTGDAEGELRRVSDTVPTKQAIGELLDTFLGESQQIPPAYSAIKVQGKRAYQLAREGKAVQLEPRTIRINRISLESYEYPTVRFTCEVSSGTYIRSLVQDIGHELGTGAYMSDLRRTTVGEYDIQAAVPPDALPPAQLLQRIVA
ncbi:tRNA pseudouridine(55) synthase TruB [Candidatus Saccharibacteria bacterium]|nr:MAG: tRNA pseudouridine(55) synthase TruB [Candidatus Saccharibacteria bacterium]